MLRVPPCFSGLRQYPRWAGLSTYGPVYVPYGMGADRLPHVARGKPVSLSCGGEPLRAYSGETVAVALHAGGADVLSRSLKYHRPRSFFCLEGHCGGCLMRIDGVPNLRACMERCADGARIEGQNAYPSPSMDVLGAVDWLFPGGMNHLAHHPVQ